jgi:hypothetical protein
MVPVQPSQSNACSPSTDRCINIDRTLGHSAGSEGGTRLRSVVAISVLAILPFVSLSYSSSSSAPPPDRVPVQAILIKAIEAGRVHVGDPVYATVDLPWDNPTCKLREGAVLKGRIVAQTPRVKGAKSELAFLFESGQCGGRDMKPLPLTIAAVLAPDPNRGTNLYGGVQSPPLSDAIGLSLGQTGTGGPMRSILVAANTVILEPPVNKPPVVVMPGQVVGLGSMKLAVAGGPEGSSVLTSEKHNLRLDTGSRLVLVPTVISAPAPTSPPASDSSNDVSTNGTITQAEVDAINDADTCAPPTCSAALDAAATETSSTAAASSIPLMQLGFAPPIDKQMYDLGYGETISYLGPKRLLFAFNPHVLVPRAGAENELPNLHVVRAALIDLATSKVVRTVDWRVHDAKQYLWPVGSESLLVHAGNEVRIYGSDLKIKQRMSLNGPLAFATVGPSGKFFAVGIVRERHSESIHRELAAAEDREPEEDVEVKVLDADFRVLVSVIRSSRDVPPVLSDDGEIRIPTIGKNRWRIAEYTWTGQRRILKQVDSTCRPEATTIPPDLLFVTGCDRLADGKWYRILRLNGKLVLKGQSSSTARGHAATGISGSQRFAVGIAELVKPTDDAAPFLSSDLHDLHVAVYQTESGKRVTAVSLPYPLPARQTFAISPDGRQLAIAANGQIVFYSLPSAAEHD